MLLFLLLLSRYYLFIWPNVLHRFYIFTLVVIIVIERMKTMPTSLRDPHDHFRGFFNSTQLYGSALRPPYHLKPVRDYQIKQL